jgi:hypothetical protein
MTRSNVEELVNQRNRRFPWEAVLPGRKAWIQTLILLPFGLPIGNFLGASWHFSVNAIVEEHQYLIGVLSMVFNLLLPSLFFAVLFHWCWYAWKEESSTWYPRTRGLWAGVYATLTMAVSFGLVALFTHSMGICGNPAWGDIGANLLCNLDGYGFESKSWFGAWFIIAAYCYQAKGSIESLYRRIFHQSDTAARFSFPETTPADFTDFTSVATLSPHDDFSVNPVETIATNGED